MSQVDLHKAETHKAGPLFSIVLGIGIVAATAASLVAATLTVMFAMVVCPYGSCLPL